MTPRSRFLAAAVAVAVIAIVGGARLVFQRAVLDPEPAPSRPAEPARPAPQPAVVEEAVIESVHGDVQRKVEDRWATAAAGDRLHADDALRTGKDARTELRIGEHSRLTVAQGTQLSIHELTAKLHRFRLRRGRVSVDYGPDGERMLRIESESGDAVAQTREARFSVLSTGQSIAIATESGAVDLSSANSGVRIEAGQQALAHPGEAPTAPRAIPRSLWLKVANANGAPGTDLCAEVRGAAPPGAEITVDGALVEADRDGVFSARVPRTAGKTAALVAIRDPAGRTVTRKVPCGEESSVRDVALRWRSSR